MPPDREYTCPPHIGGQVWEVDATGYGSTDRICDSLQTGQAVCDDLWACLNTAPEIVEDWQNLAASGDQWVRYYRDPNRDGAVQCQRVQARDVDTTGRWFR